MGSLNIIFLIAGGLGTGEILLIAVLLIPGLLLYFLPTYLAKDKVHRIGIFLLNLLTGWTFLGWIVALLWSINDTRKDKIVPIV